MSYVYRKHCTDYDSYYQPKVEEKKDEKMHKVIKIVAAVLLLIGAVFATIAILSGFGVAPWGMTAAFTGLPALAVALTAVGGMKMAATIYLFSSFLFIGLAALAIRFLIKDKKEQEEIDEVMQYPSTRRKNYETDGYQTDTDTEDRRSKDSLKISQGRVELVVNVKGGKRRGDRNDYSQPSSSKYSHAPHTSFPEHCSSTSQKRVRAEGEPPRRKRKTNGYY